MSILFNILLAAGGFFVFLMLLVIFRPVIIFITHDMKKRLYKKKARDLFRKSDQTKRAKARRDARIRKQSVQSL